MKLGAKGWIVKPFKPDLLLAAVRKIRGSRRVSLELALARGPLAGHSEPPRSRSPSLAPGHEARILVVDDDDASRQLVSEALRSVGFVVDEASNGVAALKVFKDRRPHIALLEVMTPFLDGFSTCRAMRELPGGKDVSIVMVTNTDDVDSLQFGYEAGATDFVTKPVNVTLLQHRMKYMRRSAELASELRRSERKVAKHAYYDALTGLANRRSLEQFLKGLMDRAHGGSARASERPGALFLIDLDGFERVNDTFGHAAGDELLCEVAQRMTACFDLSAVDSPRRILARLGGTSSSSSTWISTAATPPRTSGHASSRRSAARTSSGATRS